MSKSGRKNNSRKNRHHPGQHGDQTHGKIEIKSEIRPEIQIPQCPSHDINTQTCTNARREKIEHALRVVAGAVAIIGVPILLIQSCANWRQAKASEDQLREMQSEAKRSERAWLYVEVKDNMLTQQSTNYLLHTKIINSGKTLAVITGTVFYVAPNTNNIPSHDSVIGGESVVLVPNMDGNQFQEVNINIPQTAFQNSAGVYCAGTVFYRDIFDDPHWTEFCYQITESGKAGIVTKFHNSCDDAEPKSKK